METLLPSYEIWKWKKGFEGRVEFSNRGRIRVWIRRVNKCVTTFRKNPLIKKSHPNKWGYFQTSIGNARFEDELKVRVHREVSILFVPNPNDLPEANHLNGDKSCNEWWNFKWDTRVDNIGHAFETGLIKPALGEQQSNTKLTNEAVLLIYRHDAKTKKIADGFGISTHAVLDIKRGRTWWHITGHTRHIKPSEKGKYKKQ